MKTDPDEGSKYNPKSSPAQVTVYVSDFRFLFIALAFPVFGVIAVAVMMLGWRELGRRISLSPAGIKKAFGAPVLEDAGSN